MAFNSYHTAIVGCATQEGKQTMIALMGKKKQNGRETRYDPIPVSKLAEWAKKLRKYADELDACHATANHYGIEELGVDGGSVHNGRRIASEFRFNFL